MLVFVLFFKIVDYWMGKFSLSEFLKRGMLPIKNKIILFSCQCFGIFDIFAPQSGFSAVGSALRSGRRGRPFKSGNPDHKKRKFKTEFPFFVL